MAGFLLPLISGLGSLFGGMGASRDQAKKDQADTALRQYQTEMQGWQAQQGARNTQADQMAMRPTQRLQQGALGNLIEGWKPVGVEWGGAGTMPKVSGGYNDLRFNDSTLQQADLMQRDALARQLAGGQASDISQIAPMPSAPTMPKKSWLDTLLGIGGLAGGVADVWKDAKTTAAGQGIVPFNPNPEDPWSQNPQIPRPRR
jgi:hypothetical protein